MTVARPRVLLSLSALAGSRRACLNGLVGLYGAIVAFAFALMLVVLAWWTPLLDALATAALIGALNLLGGLLLRASNLMPADRLTGGALSLVLTAVVFGLIALVLGLTGAPIDPVTLLGCGLAIAVVSVIVSHRRGQFAAGRQSPVTPKPSRVPVRRISWVALAGCAALCVPVLFALATPLQQLALVLYVGAFLGVLATARDGNVAPGARATPDWQRRYAMLIPLAALLVLLATRLIPFLRSSSPLGYDTGLYRGVQRDFIESLAAMPVFAPDSWADVQPPGLYLLSSLLHLAGGNTDALLWGLLILAQLLGAIGIWMLGREIAARRAANWALILFTLSAAQYALYYQVYFKQALSLALLPYLLWLWRRESWLAIPVGVFIAATHTMGFLLMGLILISEFLWFDHSLVQSNESLLQNIGRIARERLYRLTAGASILLLGLASYAFAPGAITEVVSGDVSGTLATFGIGGDAGAGSYRVDGGLYAWMVLPLIPFAALTVAQHWRDPRLRLVSLWAGWTTAFIVLGLIFSRRFVGSLDAAFLLLAALSIAQLTTGSLASRVRPFVIIAVVASAVFLGRAVYDLTPAIDDADLRDLDAVSRQLPADAYVMAVSRADMPWVRGYGHRDTIAPGFLEHDRWTQEQWHTFWDPSEPRDRYAVLAEYDRPIYVFMRAEQPFDSIANDERFRRVSSTLWQYLEPGAAALPEAPNISAERRGALPSSAGVLERR